MFWGSEVVLFIRSSLSYRFLYFFQKFVKNFDPWLIHGLPAVRWGTLLSSSFTVDVQLMNNCSLSYLLPVPLGSYVDKTVVDKKDGNYFFIHLRIHPLCNFAPNRSEDTFSKNHNSAVSYPIALIFWYVVPYSILVYGFLRWFFRNRARNGCFGGLKLYYYFHDRPVL